MYWYFIALSTSLNAYMWRAETQEAKPGASGRGMMVPVTGFSGAQARVLGWRYRSAGSGLDAASRRDDIAISRLRD
jgi:hypothetical protein